MVGGGMLTITEIGAADLMAADKSGTSDPYVSFRLGTRKRKTPVAKKTLSHTWSEAIEFAVVREALGGEPLLVKVLDKDDLGTDDALGSLSLSLSPLLEQESMRVENQKLEGVAQGSLSLRISWEPREAPPKPGAKSAGALPVPRTTPPNSAFLTRQRAKSAGDISKLSEVSEDESASAEDRATAFSRLVSASKDSAIRAASRLLRVGKVSQLSTLMSSLPKGKRARFVVEMIQEAQTSFNRNMQGAFIGMLRGSVSLTAAAVEALLPSINRRLAVFLEDVIATIHTSPLPVGEEGPMAHYQLEVLRLTPGGSQALRRVPGKDKEAPTYRVVRKRNPFITLKQLPDASDISGRGLVRRFTCRVIPKVNAKAKPNKQALRAKRKAEKEARRQAIKAAEEAAASGEVEVPEEPPPQPKFVMRASPEGADEYLLQKFSSCPPLARCLRRSLPPAVKAQLPFDLPDDWMPLHMRDEPDKVIAMTVDLDFELRFDRGKPMLFSEDDGKSKSSLKRYSVKATQPSPFRFEMAITGNKYWPSFGQLRIDNIKVQAESVGIWWDVLDSNVDIAFMKGMPLTVDWDVEISLCGCGLPLPDCLEDKALAGLTRFVLQSFNRTNPLHLDFEEMAAEAAKMEEAKQATIEEEKRRRQGDEPPKSKPPMMKSFRSNFSRSQATAAAESPRATTTKPDDKGGEQNGSEDAHDAAAPSDAPPENPSTTPSFFSFSSMSSDRPSAQASKAPSAQASRAPSAQASRAASNASLAQEEAPKQPWFSSKRVRSKVPSGRPDPKAAAPST